MHLCDVTEHSDKALVLMNLGQKGHVSKLYYIGAGTETPLHLGRHPHSDGQACVSPSFPSSCTILGYRHLFIGSFLKCFSLDRDYMNMNRQ